MATQSTTRVLRPGSTGWRAADLDDPEVRRKWNEARLEMVHGVIAEMPAAYFDHSNPIVRLFEIVGDYFELKGVEVEFGTDVDLIVDESTVYRADGVMLLPDDVERQLAAQREHGEADDMLYSLRIAPPLVIESASKGHELHDRVTKRDDYARFGVPNYWILSQREKSLECYVIDEAGYKLELSDRSPAAVTPSAFPGLTIPLDKVFR